MPGYVNNMQQCVGGYPVAPVSMQAGSMSPNPLMQPIPDVNINSGTYALPESPVLPVAMSMVQPSSAPPGLPPPGLAPPGMAQAPGEKNFQLTELTVQINMLSEEVRRLQNWIIPQNMVSTGTGSPMQSGSPVSPGRNSGSSSSADAISEADTRSFEQQVASLQNELKRVICEGQRSGKIPMKDNVLA